MTYLRNLIFILVYKIKYKLNIRNYKLYSFERTLQKSFRKEKEFSFIQVGANDGVSFDDLYSFVTNRKSKGIVIEPIKEYFHELVGNYINFKNIKPVNMAVYLSKATLKIYKINPDRINKYPDWVKGIASLDKDHHQKTGILVEDMITENVDADHLMKIIHENYTGDIKNIDLFQVDTEGFDYQIIKMIDFNIMSPKVIKFENVNLKEIQRKELNTILFKKGYKVFNEGGDTIALNLRKALL